MDNYIVLWLEAPLQSWGVDSHFYRRNTNNFPTKSGVSGLILSGMGASGEQRELLERISNIDMTVFSYIRKPIKDQFFVINENQPLLQDFHMIGSGFDNNNDRRNKLRIPKRYDRKSANGGPKRTFRYYLQDSFFSTILHISNDEELSRMITKALQNPVYDICLGRRSCVPTDFVFRGMFSLYEEAKVCIEEIVIEKKLKENFKVIEGISDEGENIVLNDIPLCFGLHKKYRSRQVTLIYS